MNTKEAEQLGDIISAIEEIAGNEPTIRWLEDHDDHIKIVIVFKINKGSGTKHG